MLNLLLPFIGTLASGALSFLGSQQSSAQAQRIAMINASLQAQQNADNLAQVSAANATTADQWERAFAYSQNQAALSRFDAQNANALALHEAQVDRQIQKDMAYQGIQFRAADARAAGIHPLAAMGAQIAAPSPISLSSEQANYGGAPSAGSYAAAQGVAPQLASNSFRGQGLANMGQDLSRAFHAMQTQTERNHALENAQAVANLRHTELGNSLLSAQIARVRGAGTGPSAPYSRGSNAVPGQGDTVEMVKSEIPYSSAAGIQSGAFPASQAFIRPGGAVGVGPSQPRTQQTEDDPLAKFMDTALENLGRTFNLLPLPEGVDPSQGYIPFWGYAPKGRRIEGHDVRGRF